MKPADPHRDYANHVLVLQGGGALGSYQAGVYEALVASGHSIDWVAGISIGAINAALIAGNPPERRVERLREFWEQICRQPLLPPLPVDAFAIDLDPLPRPMRQWLAIVQSSRAILEGQAGFFVPRLPPLPWLAGATDTAHVSYYDTTPLAATLGRLVDFDRINHRDAMRVSIGAVQVRTGDLVYFDNRDQRLGVEHFLASAALPPSFPAVQVEGEYYWDGGIIMNTPLMHVLMSEPRRDTLVFQIDLWSAKGVLPTSLPEAEERKKDILYSSRTRMVNHYMRDQQVYRKCIHDLLALVPEARRDEPAAVQALKLACDRRCAVLQLICADAVFEGNAKDFEFGTATMRRHWRSGIVDLQKALAHPEWLAMPTAAHPFQVYGTAVDPPASSHPEEPRPFAAKAAPGETAASASAGGAGRRRKAALPSR